MAEPHPQGPCASVDHRMWNYFVVWCPHRQQYTLHSSAFLETGTDDDPVDYVTRRIELGPFDNEHDVVNHLTAWLNEDHLAGGTGTPRLPG